MSKTKIKALERCLFWVLTIILAVFITIRIVAAPKDKADTAYTNSDVSSYIAPLVNESSAPASNSDISVASPSDIIVEEPEESIPLYKAPNPYADLVVTDEEKELLACMACSEAANQCFDGQIAVVQVALNRYMHPAYSGSISEILFSPNQFVVGTVYSQRQMEAVEAALAGEPVLDLNTDVVYFSTGSLTYGSYYKTIGDHVFRTYS